MSTNSPDRASSSVEKRKVNEVSDVESSSNKQKLINVENVDKRKYEEDESPQKNIKKQRKSNASLHQEMFRKLKSLCQLTPSEVTSVQIKDKGNGNIYNVYLSSASYNLFSKFDSNTTQNLNSLFCSSIDVKPRAGKINYTTFKGKHNTS